MREDFASVVNFIMKNVGKNAKAQDYYENIKDGFKLPAIYFPEPECNLSKDTFGNQYQHSNMLFVQIFHLTNDDAYSLASDIANEFFKTGCYIPIINFDGNEAGLFLHINVQKVSRIDDCVAQVQLSWNYGSRYLNSENKANNINLNFNMEG